MRLSILTCHLKSRRLFLEQLVQCLEPQLTPEVEHLIDDTDGLSIGVKRNSLLARASGGYVAYVDDDDILSHNYVSLILAAIQTNPDCVGIRGVLQDYGKVQGVFEHSIRHKDWVTKDGDIKWLRPPNHLNPIRREHALKAGFPDMNCGEDFHYSMAVQPYLKTEIFIEPVIYLYQHHGK